MGIYLRYSIVYVAFQYGHIFLNAECVSNSVSLLRMPVRRRGGRVRGPQMIRRRPSRPARHASAVLTSSQCLSRHDKQMCDQEEHDAVEKK